jgi:hypothetical protein
MRPVNDKHYWQQYYCKHKSFLIAYKVFNKVLGVKQSINEMLTNTFRAPMLGQGILILKPHCHSGLLIPKIVLVS